MNKNCSYRWLRWFTMVLFVASCGTTTQTSAPPKPLSPSKATASPAEKQTLEAKIRNHPDNPGCTCTQWEGPDTRGGGDPTCTVWCSRMIEGSSMYKEEEDRNWKEFREAVMSGDPQAVGAFVDFPLSCFVYDKGPHWAIEREGFAEFWPKLMAVKVEAPGVGTVKEMILAADEIPLDELSKFKGEAFKMGRLFFLLTDNGWRLDSIQGTGIPVD